MARPTVIRDEAIIDAAREVFLARGIRATAAEVAERAGVSEGSIFKRWKSKFELFHCAMRPQLEEPQFLDGLSERVGQGDVRETLFRLGMDAITLYRLVTPLMMMAWSNPGPDHVPCVLREPSPPPVRTLRKLASYFEAEMRAGRLRRHDPEIVARTFLGAIHNYVFFELMFCQQDLPMPAETFMRGLVELLTVGVLATPTR